MDGRTRWSERQEQDFQESRIDGIGDLGMPGSSRHADRFTRQMLTLATPLAMPAYHGRHEG